MVTDLCFEPQKPSFGAPFFEREKSCIKYSLQLRMGPRWGVGGWWGSAQFYIFKENTLTPGWHIITKEHSILDPYLDKIWALKTLDNWITCTFPNKAFSQMASKYGEETKKKFGNSRNLSPAVFWWRAVTNVGRGPIMAINFLHKCQCNLQSSSSSWWQFLPSSSWFSKSRATVDIYVFKTSLERLLFW